MLIRWFIFLFIGLPFQCIFYLIYPLIYSYWILAIYKESPKKGSPSHAIIDPSVGRDTIHDGALLNNKDNHGAFTMYGFIQNEGLELLQVQGNLIRRRNPDGLLERNNVSGDVVVAWFFANALAQRPVKKDTLENVANTYMKNLGTLSFDEVADGYVSVRCANFGINESKDSDFLKMSQPAAGPQFYTTSAVLASIYNNGLKYKVMFWAHWLMMGGWYWAFAPIIYPKTTGIWYARDITMKSLYIHLQVFGPRWWIKKPMQFINDKISSHKNELFDAMMGREISELPPVMNPFFSQREDASSTNSDMGDRNSAYIADAIKKIKKDTRYNE
jgi:hypothetical protein